MSASELNLRRPYLASAGPDGSWRHWPTEHQQFLAWGYSNDGLLCCWSNTFWSPDSRRHLLTVSLLLWPLKLYPVLLSSENCSMSTFSIAVSILKVSIRSPLILLSSIVSPSLCNLDSYSNFFNVDTILVAVLWTLSRVYMSFTRWGDHTWIQYSMCGLTYVL